MTFSAIHKLGAAVVIIPVCVWSVGRWTVTYQGWILLQRVSYNITSKYTKSEYSFREFPTTLPVSTLSLNTPFTRDLTTTLPVNVLSLSTPLTRYLDTTFPVSALSLKTHLTRDLATTLALKSEYSFVQGCKLYTCIHVHTTSIHCNTPVLHLYSTYKHHTCNVAVMWV